MGIGNLFKGVSKGTWTEKSKEENPALKLFLSFPYFFFGCCLLWSRIRVFPLGFDQCPLQYVKWSPQTLTTLRDGVFGHENKADITPRLLSLITASLHALFVCLLPEISSQQDFSWTLYMRKALRIWSLSSHTPKKKCFHFLGSTSNFCLCNKQVLKPRLSHLERICVPAHSPQRSFFEAREASALFPYLRLWLSKAARHVLQPYWTWGLQDGLQRRLNAVKGEVAPHAAASVSRCWKEPVTNYINGMILEINFLQHFVSV